MFMTTFSQNPNEVNRAQEKNFPLYTSLHNNISPLLRRSLSSVKVIRICNRTSAIPIFKL